MSTMAEDEFADYMRQGPDCDLDPALQAYVETSESGMRMIRHPLVYHVPYMGNPYWVNKVFEQAQNDLAAAVEKEDWWKVVGLHERPYRLDALIDHVAGEDDQGRVFPVSMLDADGVDLALWVWQDCENIRQNIGRWAELFDVPDGYVAFDSNDASDLYERLPETFTAWRGGTSGAWSWTLDRSVAAKFAGPVQIREGQPELPVREDIIGKQEVFAVLTARGETELLVRYDPRRRDLLWPTGAPDGWDETARSRLEHDDPARRAA